MLGMYKRNNGLASVEEQNKQEQRECTIKKLEKRQV